MRKNALWVEFDGRSSMGFDVYQVNFENGLMQTETLIPDRSINKVQRQNSSVVDFYSVTNSPLTFSVFFYCEKELTEDRKVEIIKWLNKNTYKTMRFETMPDNYYYAIATKIDVTHDTMEKGYFTAEFECNSPYAYTELLMSDEYTITDAIDIDIKSNSVFETSVIKVIGTINEDSDLLIKSQTNNSELNFTELRAGDKFTIDCLNHNIYAWDSNGNEILLQENKQSHSWLIFEPGNNHLMVNGKCDFQIFWQGNRV